MTTRSAHENPPVQAVDRERNVSNDRLSPASSFRATSAPRPHAPIWLLVMITFSGTLAMHIFVPALPDAAAHLHVTAQAMQLTISVYILGLAAGQLVYGPLSDSFGRRPLLLTGLALYTAGGLAALFATNVHVLIVARLFQALGGCAGLALGRAIVRDTAPPDDAVRHLALMNLMMMIGPGLAPVIGSGLVSLAGWRAIFVMLVLMGTVTIICTWRIIPETGSPTGVVSARTLVRDYASLFRSRVFLGYTLGGGCTTTSVYGFIAAAPFIITRELHRPLHEVGFYLAILIVGMSLGNATTRRFVSSMPIDRLIIGGNAVSLICAIVFLVLGASHTLTITSAIGLMTVYAWGAGTASPAALSRALGVDSKLVGSAAGLYGCLQMFVGAVCTTLVGFGSSPAIAAGVVLTGASIVGQLSFISAALAQRKM